MGSAAWMVLPVDSENDLDAAEIKVSDEGPEAQVDEAWPVLHCPLSPPPGPHAEGLLSGLCLEYLLCLYIYPVQSLTIPYLFFSPSTP